MHINETAAKSAPAPATGNVVHYDGKLKGFGLRVTAKDARSFVLNYHLHGRERRFTIGRYPTWSAMLARKEAERLKRLVDLGEDPLATRIEARQALTVSELCAEYEKRHLPRKRPSSQRDDLSMIKRIIKPEFGNRKAASLSFADVEQLHSTISARAPYQANRLLALLSKIYSLGIKWEYVTNNPTKGIERNSEHPRQRYLDDGELARLLKALDERSDNPAANAVRLLVLTGARRSEVLSATWEQFSFDGNQWEKPAGSTKAKRMHRIPVSDEAGLLLQDMRAADPEGKHLFPSRVRGQPIGDITTFWQDVCRSAKLQGVRLHDLRHTFASHIASAGNSLPLIGALLGHTQAQTTQRYAHLLDDPLRKAVNSYGQKIKSKRPQVEEGELQASS